MEPSRNLLSLEKSPYLLQHAQNPVHWMGWNAASFEKAQRENKPIFLSIGYSTCHWCHVMAHESFEDTAVAEILNEHFVCIKVDREERPDVDRLYMNYVQATTGSGGWPMSVWLTPQLQPFYGGTYFPPNDRFNRPGFSTLLRRIHAAWTQDRERIVQTAAESIAALAEQAHPTDVSGVTSTAPAEKAFQSLLSQFDEEEGGFSYAPKFPRPAALHFLLQHADRLGAQSRDGQVAMAMALHTLRKMALGGMHDQLGGGFHRYSVDRLWHVPHYEKMLYDQAQLVNAYLEAAQLSGDTFFHGIARSTLDYVLTEMRDPTGGFHSAEDADSLFEAGKTEHGEGVFYVWTKAEIDALLGEDAAFFNAVYGVEEAGNSPKGSDPLGELKGKNTLVRRLSPAAAAQMRGGDEASSEAALAHCRTTLLRARALRPRPHRDDKILTAWNGLMLSAFARGYCVLEDSRYLEAARGAASFLHETMWKNNALLRTYRQGAGSVPGFAEDYAYLVQGLLDLFEADFDLKWLRWAVEVQLAQNNLFWDEQRGGYFSSPAADPFILVRLKDDNDGAEPSSNSVSVRNLRRLFELTGRTEFQQYAQQTVNAFGGILQQMPSALPQMLHSMGCSQDPWKPWRQVVIAGDLQKQETRALLRVARGKYLLDSIVLHANSLIGVADLGARLELAAEMRPLPGKEGMTAAAYVCENFTCQAPVSTPEELSALLEKREQ